MGRALKYGSLGVLDDRNIRGTLESAKKAKFGGSYSHADDVAYESEQKKRQATIRKQAEFEATIDNRSILEKQKWMGVEGPVDLLKRDINSLTAEEKKSRAKLESALINASTKQLEELEQEQRLAMIGIMTQAQIDSLNKSDNLSEDEKDQINDKRSQIIKKRYATQTDRDKLSKASVDDLSSLGVDFLKDNKHAVRLTGGQMDDLKKKMAPTEFQQVSDARETALKQLAEGGEPIDGKTAQNHILKMKASDMSKLPREVLLSLAGKLPIATLIEIAKNNTLNTDDQKAIRNSITDEIKMYASNNHNLSEEEKKELNAVNDFFDKNPYGAQFGK
jgi:hypothetical protein